MHSRTYFSFRTFLVDSAALLIFVLSLFALSFFIFSIGEIESTRLLESGAYGLLTFAGLFPWMILLVSIALLVALEAVLRRFSFGYRYPALRMFLWIALIGVAGSVLVELTPLHSYLLNEARRNQLPVFNSLYTPVLELDEIR